MDDRIPVPTWGALTEHSSPFSPRRRGTLAASAVAHGLLGTVLVLGPLWAVHEPSEPPERMRPFPIKQEPIRAALVDAPRGNLNGGSPRASSLSPSRPVNVQPRAIPDAIPQPPLSAAADEPGDAAAATAMDDESFGFGPGIVSGPVGVPDGGASEIYQANAPDVIAPVAISTVEPVYPSVLIHIGKEGIVILEAVISAAGEVQSARVLRSADPFLDRAALEAVSKWRYRPARIGERAVAVYLTVTVSFRIRR